MVAVAWNEAGVAKRTTRSSWDEARKWAKAKAATLDASTGARWVTPAAAERLAWLDRLSGVSGGGDEPGRLLADVEAALGLLAEVTGQASDGRTVRLEEAVRWFVESGMAGARKMTLAAAAEGYIGEYEGHHESASARPMRSELRTLVARLSVDGRGDMPLTDLTQAMLADHVRRGDPAPRTIRNRVAVWTTFLRRAQALEWWPDGRRLPTAALKKPMKEDRAPEIFTPDEGLAILKAIREHLPRYLPYLLIAGWLGCRPSECLRLKWSDFDWEAGMLHVTPDVARKTRRERWVPMDAAVAALLRDAMGWERHHSASPGKPCLAHSRMFVSRWVREHGVVSRWPADVLRHSYITHRMQVLANIDKTAEEAGNSPREIRASYRRPIRAGQGERWFSAVGRVMGHGS